MRGLENKTEGIIKQTITWMHLQCIYLRDQKNIPSNAISVDSILNDFVTSEAEAFSNLTQMKAIKSPQLDGVYSKVLLRKLWKKYAEH